LAIAVAFVACFAQLARAQPSGFVYTLQNVNDPLPTNQIFGFSIDALTGVLTLLPGFPIASGGAGDPSFLPTRIAYANGRLFVINGGSGTLSAFTVNRTTGVLTPLPFSPVALGDGSWFCVSVHPSGSPVLVGNAAGSVRSFNVTPTTATPAQGSPFSTGTVVPYSCEFSRDGNYFYAGNNSGVVNSNLFVGFAVSSNSGVLTPLPGSPFDSGADVPLGYATDRTGRLFIVNWFANQVRAFTTAAGVPTGVTGNPFTSGLTQGVHGVLHPAGFYMVADNSGSRVGVYRINGSGAATTLAAVSGSPFPSGGLATETLALAADGRFLIAANQFSRDLTVFQVNSGTGALASIGVTPVPGAQGGTDGVVFVPVNPYPFDLDADRKTDVGVFTPGGVFSILKSTSNHTPPPTQFAWGLGTDVPAPADYDGDKKHDIAVYRNGIWWILFSSTDYTTHVGYAWGASTDIPVPADYDGDGRAELAVFRPSDGVWWILESRSNYTTYVAHQWGASTDKPVPADYDSDGRADIAIFRPSAGEWWILRSSLNYTTFSAHAFGASGDTAAPGDFDADGWIDLGLFRPGTPSTWYVLVSQSGYASYLVFPFGAATDTPVVSDYDGDGKADVAVYRASSGVWYLLTSSSNYSALVWHVHGSAADIPLPRR
jgi:6-phosphogluconolactonase (cycloisomerase 2 family)